MYSTDIDDWILRVAQNMARSKPELIDDLAQEGRVAAWEAWNGHRAPEDVGYAKAAARKQMLSIVSGQRRMLGSENARQKIVKDEPTDPVELPVIQELVADYILLAYHHGEIYAAISALPSVQKRSTVLLMCDQRLTRAEQRAWSDARPKLATQLAHLKELVTT